MSFSLNPDALVHTCSFLDGFEILNATSHVSRLFRLVGQREGLWHEIFSRHFGDNTKLCATWREEFKAEFTATRSLKPFFPLPTVIVPHRIHSAVTKCIPEIGAEKCEGFLKYRSSSDNIVACSDPIIKLLDEFLESDQEQHPDLKWCAVGDKKALDDLELRDEDNSHSDEYFNAGNFWKELQDISCARKFMRDMLLQSDRFHYNLYCINSRNAKGQFSKTDEEKTIDAQYTTAAGQFIDRFLSVSPPEACRYFVAAHVAVRGDEFGLDRDEIIAIVGRHQIFAFWCFYSRCYG